MIKSTPYKVTPGNEVNLYASKSSIIIKHIPMRKFLLFSLTILLTFGFIRSTYAANGPGSAWSFYRQITLSPATPSANFQVMVTLAAGQYSNMNSTDGRDLRFYDNANNNCEYWIQTWNTSGTSTIWVKVPTSGETTLAMYYGNASASAASNGTNTFAFFNDGSSLTGWTNVNASVDNTIGQPLPSLKAVGTQYAYLNIGLTTNTILEYSNYVISGTPLCNLYFLTNSAGAGQMFRLDARGTPNYSGFASSASWASWTAPITSTTAITANTWYSVKIAIKATSADGYINGASYGSYTFANNGGYIAVHGDGATVTGGNFDNIRVRQYTASEPVASAGSETINPDATSVPYSSSGNFTVPTGVTSLTVECWGGGGRGGSRTNSGNGGGAGGGAYSTGVVPVVSGSTYAVVVGTGSTLGTSPGGDSWFNTAATVMAKGGSSVADNSATGAAGGQSTACVGTLKYNGGAGATGTGTYGGGGGSSAGSGAVGNNGSTSTGGTAPTEGGAGGAGRSGSSGVGIAGSAPGGGGGGAYRTSGGGSPAGGSGANGQVIISWISCTPPAAPTVTSPINYCQNIAASQLTATGSNLLWYTVPTGGAGSSTAPTPSTSTTGTTSYYVTQTIICESPRAKIDVIIYPNPLAAVNSQTNLNCFEAGDGTITIHGSIGTGPYNYSVDDGLTWVPSATDPYIYGGLIANQPYRIKVKDSHGCISK